MKGSSVAPLWIAFAIGLLAVPQNGFSQQQIGSMNVTVARHTDALTDGGSTQKLADATNLLQTINTSCAADYRVCVQLTKLGSTTTFGLFGDGYDNITSQAELLQVFNSWNDSNKNV